MPGRSAAKSKEDSVGKVTARVPRVQQGGRKRLFSPAEANNLGVSWHGRAAAGHRHRRAPDTLAPVPVGPSSEQWSPHDYGASGLAAAGLGQYLLTPSPHG